MSHEEIVTCVRTRNTMFTKAKHQWKNFKRKLSSKGNISWSHSTFLSTKIETHPDRAHPRQSPVRQLWKESLGKVMSSKMPFQVH